MFRRVDFILFEITPGASPVGVAGEAAEALAGRSMSAAEGRLKSRLDTLSDGDRRAVEDAVATHPDPPNRGGPTPPFPFPSRTLPAILRTPASGAGRPLST